MEHGREDRLGDDPRAFGGLFLYYSRRGDLAGLGEVLAWDQPQVEAMPHQPNTRTVVGIDGGKSARRGRKPERKGGDRKNGGRGVYGPTEALRYINISSLPRDYIFKFRG